LLLEQIERAITPEMKTGFVKYFEAYSKIVAADSNLGADFQAQQIMFNSLRPFASAVDNIASQTGAMVIYVPSIVSRTSRTNVPPISVDGGVSAGTYMGTGVNGLVGVPSLGLGGIGAHVLGRPMYGAVSRRIPGDSVFIQLDSGRVVVTSCTSIVNAFDSTQLVRCSDLEVKPADQGISAQRKAQLLELNDVVLGINFHKGVAESKEAYKKRSDAYCTATGLSMGSSKIEDHAAQKTFRGLDSAFPTKPTVWARDESALPR
jgi:hypothetical protein